MNWSLPDISILSWYEPPVIALAHFSIPQPVDCYVIHVLILRLRIILNKTRGIEVFVLISMNIISNIPLQPSPTVINQF